MKKINSSIFVIIIFGAMFLSSCLVTAPMVQANAEKKITVESGAIPPKIGIHNSIMLIAFGDKSYNKATRQYFDWYYIGDYHIMTSKELMSDFDYKEYRYIFSYDEKQYTWYDSNHMPRTGTMRQFYVLDRSTNIKHESPVKSAMYGRIMRAYINKLNERITFNRKRLNP